MTETVKLKWTYLLLPNNLEDNLVPFMLSIHKLAHFPFPLFRDINSISTMISDSTPPALAARPQDKDAFMVSPIFFSTVLLALLQK